MQVVDLRRQRRGREPEVAVLASAPAELLRAIAVVADAANPDHDYDVGHERLAGLRDRLSDRVRADLDAVGAPDRTLLFLTGLVTHLADDAGVGDLLALLDDQPLLTWRHLAAGVAELDLERSDLADELADGDDDVETISAALAELVGDDDPDGVVGQLLSRDPLEYGRSMADLVGRFHEELGASMLAEAAGPIEREVAARRRQLDDGMAVHELVVAASNGFEPGAAGRLLLLPSYWLRPWVVVVTEGDTEVLTTPVADEQLQLPSQAPTPGTLKLFKALGDEGRLRLLRRMSGGPIGLSEAMEELDVAKTTAHHHLSILRQAGLVTIREQGRGKSYELRRDPSATAWAALVEYVGPVASTDGPEAVADA